MAGILYEGVRSTADGAGKLFEGQSFWFSSAVPQRKWLIENAIANGATVVPLEKQADVLIVDHARKNAPVGTHSYKYIEQSIRNGVLEDLADHVVGPSKSVDRPVGSMITAPKGSRSKYTEAEDQLLWNFIKPYETAGGATGGNEIYKQLEEAHGTGRHTYQSWRDRWLKHVRFQNRQFTDSAYTANDAEGGTTQAQQVVQASPRRRALAVAPPAVSSPRKAVCMTDSHAPLNSQRPTRTVPTNLEDATTAHFRQALERKLGRALPSGPSSLNFRDWEPLPPTWKAQDGAVTDALEPQRPKAGRGTHLPAETDLLEPKPPQISQPDSQEAVTEDAPASESQASIEEFLEEEYKLLLAAAGHIIRVGDQEEDWDKLASQYPSHSSKSWRVFWEEKVKPDYLKQLPQIKKEQELPESEISTLETLRKVARGSVKRSNKARLSDEGNADQREGAVEEVASREDVEDEGSQHEDAVSHSPSSTATSASPRKSSPFSCRWIGCDADIPNLSMLIEHVSSRHKPGTEKVANDRGYTCRWRGCSKVRADENGNPILLDLRVPQVWANHFIKEHIRTIQLRHGLGPSPVKQPRAENEPGEITNAAVESEAASSGSDNSQVMLGSPGQRSTLVSPRRRERRISVLLDESSEEANLVVDTSEDDSDEGEEAEETEETERTSSSAKLTNEEIPLSTSEEDLSPISSEDDDDRDPNVSPRRSKRLRNTPRPPHIKDAAITYVDAAVGSSPPLPAQSTPDRDTTNHLIQPLLLSPSKPPEPNEARKRSATKGNSQESNQSIMDVQETLGLQNEESDEQPIMSSSRKRTRKPEAEPEPEPELESARQESPKLPDRPSFAHQVKRRKQRHDETEPLEIPTTPEHRTVLGDLQQDDEYEASSMLGGSPTPQPRARLGSVDNNIPQTPTRRADSQDESHDHTSPLQISMFSDPDNKFVPSSPAKSTSTRQDDLSSEPDLQFETAPQMTSNLWVTAPSEEPEEDPEQETPYETAPEPKGKERERLDTQSLFGQSIPDVDNDHEDPFALPEPDGGWPDDMDDGADFGGPLTELPMPTSYQPERAGDADEDEEEEEDAASIPSDVPAWVEERTAEDESLDLEALLCAIQATSGFNEKLIIEVHDFIRARELQGHPETLPRHMRGCWTAQDDESLKGNDARERLRILKKHGRSNVDRRCAWLDVEY